MYFWNIMRRRGAVIVVTMVVLVIGLLLSSAIASVFIVGLGKIRKIA
jgi:hypothetical protein